MSRPPEEILSLHFPGFSFLVNFIILNDMKTIRLVKGALIAGTFLAAATLCAQSVSGYHIRKIFSIEGNDGWDYLAVEPGSGRLFVSHGTQVAVVDRSTGDSVGTIANTTGVHGITFDTDLGRGYTSNGRLDNVTVFDLKTLTVLTQVPTGKDPDAIFFEPYTKRIITCNGHSDDISIIDPVADTVVATIWVGGKPETAVSNGRGMIYINIEDKSEIAAVNITTNTVTNRWSLAPGEGPTGLAYDPETDRLFSGCDGQLIIMAAADGQIIAHLPIGDHCDGVAFDPEQKRIFTSNGEGTVTIIKEESADQFKVEDTVPTRRGARTIALDPVTHDLYLSSADLGETPATTAENLHPRPTQIPGTFKVLVLGK